MTFREYETQAAKTAFFPDDWRLVYPALGLAGETGEVMEKVKKLLRGDYGSTVTEEWRDSLRRELGDVLWYLAALANQFGLSLEEVAQANLEKLRDRQERGVLGGSGDFR